MANIKLSKHERDHMIKVMEEAAGIPVSQFRTFADNWTRSFRFDNVYDDVASGKPQKKQTARKRHAKKQKDMYDEYGYELREGVEDDGDDEAEDEEYYPEADEEDYDEESFSMSIQTKPEDEDQDEDDETTNGQDDNSDEKKDKRWPLTGEVLDIISKIQATDDADLKEWAYLLAHESLRYWFIRMSKKYARTQQERRDFFSATEEVFAIWLPKYRSDMGMLTTYFEPRIKKALGEERRQKNHKNSTRHYEAQYKVIEQCKAMLAQTGNYDPDPREISAFASLHLNKDISVQAIINCLNQIHTQVAIDDGIGYGVSEEMAGPEDQLMRKADIAILLDEIDKMPPLQKRIMTLRLQSLRENDKDLPLNELVKAVQKFCPGIMLGEVRRANNAAQMRIEQALNGNVRRDKVALNGVSQSAQDVQAEADEVCESIDMMNGDSIFEPM